MKALILAGGRGKRLEGISEPQNKCMLRLIGKPLIEYNLDNAVDADVDEIIIVVGYKAEDIVNTYGLSYNGKPVKYVFQPEQRGLVHAIECSANIIGKDDFMLFLGDEILINPKHQLMIDLFLKESLFGICGIVLEENKNKIRKTYAIVQYEDQRIYKLIEKPENPVNILMGTGNCVFKNEILSYISQTPINQKRGEKELPDLIQCAIDNGETIKSFVICDIYANVNLAEDFREIESFLLKNELLNPCITILS